MTPTCKLIAKQTVGSGGAANVEFTSIPATYTDLLLLFTVRADNSNSAYALKLRFNGASADTNHSARLLYGNSSSALSGSDSFARCGYASGSTRTASTFTSNEVYIPNYSGSANKSYSATSVAEHNGSSADDAYIASIAGLWSSTNAITDIKIMPNLSVNFVEGSSFFLYGITKA